MMRTDYFGIKAKEDGEDVEQFAYAVVTALACLDGDANGRTEAAAKLKQLLYPHRLESEVMRIEDIVEAATLYCSTDVEFDYVIYKQFEHFTAYAKTMRKTFSAYRLNKTVEPQCHAFLKALIHLNGTAKARANVVLFFHQNLEATLQKEQLDNVRPTLQLMLDSLSDIEFVPQLSKLHSQLIYKDY